MTYVDGFVVPVPVENRDTYRNVAAKAAEVFKDHGALQVVECWGDDIPAGKTNDFRTAVMAKEGENVVFSWIVWPSKDKRNAGMAASMADERLKMDDASMPFDGKRMIFGGFAAIVDTGAEK